MVTSWLLQIEDMKARILAVSGDGAWALSEDFELHQRYGISRENPAGNFWKPLSHKLRSVAGKRPFWVLGV